MDPKRRPIATCMASSTSKSCYSIQILVTERYRTIITATERYRTIITVDLLRDVRYNYRDMFMEEDFELLAK